MKYIATNNAESTLASGIGAGDVTLTLTTGTGALFPSPGANEAFKLRLKEGATMEIVDCTSRLGDVCTVIRAREGTSASAFNAGASVVNTITAEHLMSKIDDDAIPVGSDKEIMFNDAGMLASDEFFKFDKNNDSLVLGNATILPGNPLSIAATVDSYTQVAFQNRSNGEFASTDYIAWADNGSDEANYIDLGINSSLFADPSFSFSGPNDGYLYVDGGDLVIGTATTGKSVKFYAEGTTSSDYAGEWGIGGIDLPTGSNFTINGSAVFELTANKGQANGYASLGADGKVPAGQLPASSSTFLGLSDTPSSYTGQQGKVVAVNSAQNALEFISAGGSGDMLASVYDPSNIASNVFSCDNHVGGTTNKVFTATEQSKLAGIAAGAEVNVNADWNAGSGDAQILNKPSTFAPSSHNNSAHSEPFGIVYYGTGAPPTAVGKSDGTLYFKYTP